MNIQETNAASILQSIRWEKPEIERNLKIRISNMESFEDMELDLTKVNPFLEEAMANVMTEGRVKPDTGNCLNLLSDKEKGLQYRIGGRINWENSEICKGHVEVSLLTGIKRRPS